MAKRVPKGDEPYRPVSEALIRSVLTPGDGGGGGTALAEPPPVAKPEVRDNGSTKADNEPPATTSKTEGEQRARVVPLPKRELERAPLARAVVTSDAIAEKRDREKRMLLTRTEERDVERLVSRLASELGTSLKLSHVLRAYVLMLLHAEDDLLERARKSPPLIRPGNGNAPELADFEQRIAQILLGAFRDAPALR